MDKEMDKNVKMRKTKLKITYRGWQGHFIADCKYHLNTLVEYGSKKVVVSSVGGFYRGGEAEFIGAGRFYETFSFVAQKNKKTGFIDADVHKLLTDYCYYYTDEPFEYKTEKKVEKMHRKIVKEICEHLESGKRIYKKSGKFV